MKSASKTTLLLKIKVLMLLMAASGAFAGDAQIIWGHSEVMKWEVFDYENPRPLDSGSGTLTADGLALEVSPRTQTGGVHQVYVGRVFKIASTMPPGTLVSATLRVQMFSSAYGGYGILSVGDGDGSGTNLWDRNIHSGYGVVTMQPVPGQGQTETRIEQELHFCLLTEKEYVISGIGTSLNTNVTVEVSASLNVVTLPEVDFRAVNLTWERTGAVNEVVASVGFSTNNITNLFCMPVWGLFWSSTNNLSGILETNPIWNSWFAPNNQEQTRNINLELWAAPPGSSYLILLADYENQFSEGNENNNWLALPFVPQTNNPPTLTNATYIVNENQFLNISLTDLASDPQEQAWRLNYSVLSAPDWVYFNEFSKTLSGYPPEEAGSTSHIITVVVADNGNPSLRATNTVNMVVREVNSPPYFGYSDYYYAEAGVQFQMVINAFDSDIPANNLSYSLLEAPMGMLIDRQTGTISWTPRYEDSTIGTHAFRIRVQDDGLPPLSATNTFQVFVQPGVRKPQINSQSIRFSPSGFSLAIGGASPDCDTVLILQRSEDLLSWQNILTNSLCDATMELTDPQAPNFPRGFYRVLEAPQNVE